MPVGKREAVIQRAGPVIPSDRWMAEDRADEAQIFCATGAKLCGQWGNRVMEVRTEVVCVGHGTQFIERAGLIFRTVEQVFEKR